MLLSYKTVNAQRRFLMKIGYTKPLETPRKIPKRVFVTVTTLLLRIPSKRLWHWPNPTFSLVEKRTFSIKATLLPFGQRVLHHPCRCIKREPYGVMCFYSGRHLILLQILWGSCINALLIELESTLCRREEHLRPHRIGSQNQEQHSKALRPPTLQ